MRYLRVPVKFSLLRTRIRYFGHAKILEYCKRPFSNLDDMNEGLIQRWNTRVRADDTVYHLGDFAMGPKQNIFIRQRLNGKIILVKGNHDRSAEVMRTAGFDQVHNNLSIEIEGYKIYLAHIPNHLPDATDRHYDKSLIKTPPLHYDFFFCGHVHEQWNRQGNTINVGVDASDYKPLSLHELITRDHNDENDAIS